MESPVNHFEHEELQSLVSEKFAHLADANDRLEKLMDEKVDRLHDEDVRLGNRVSILERDLSQLNELTISVKELAMSINTMCKEQENMHKIQEADGARLRALEDKDGNKWRKMWGYILPPLATLILGFLFAQFGLA